MTIAEAVRIEAASFSIAGPKGQSDDRLLLPVTVREKTVFAVADGVGGAIGGGEAAELSLQALVKGLEAGKSLDACFANACELIARASLGRPKFENMATTLSAVLLEKGEANVAHVGDTRIYHLRGEGIITRTIDQTEVAELLRQKVITPEQAQKYPRRNVIFSYLSSKANFTIHKTKFKFQKGDSIVLLSDGVYNEIRKSEISSAFMQSGSADEFSSSIESTLREKGFRDDSTFLVVFAH